MQLNYLSISSIQGLTNLHGENIAIVNNEKRPKLTSGNIFALKEFRTLLDVSSFRGRRADIVLVHKNYPISFKLLNTTRFAFVDEQMK